MAVPAPTPSVLAQALLALGGREAQLLELCLVEGLGLEQVAGHLGISRASLETGVLRAAWELETRLATTPGVRGHASEETASARALGRWLEGQTPFPPGAPSSARVLREDAAAIREALASERDRRDTGPAAARRETLRRLFLAGLVAGTLYLYFRGGK